MAEIDVRIASNQQSTSRLIRDLKDTRREMGRVGDATDTLERNLKDVSRAGERAFDGVSDGAKKAKRDVDSLTKSLERQQDRFDKTSKNVALAGDAQSNLGALSGLAGAAGAGGLSQGISIGGEGLALLEELPRLKESFKGLPDVARASAQSLGTNVATMGALGIAVGALTVVYQLAAKAAKENLKANQAILDSQDMQRELAIDYRDATEEQIASDIRAAEIALEKAQANKVASDAQLEAVKSLAGWQKGLANVMAFLGIGDQTLKAIRKDSKKDTQALRDAELELSATRNAAKDAGKDLAEIDKINSKASKESVKSRKDEASETMKATSALEDAAKSIKDVSSSAKELASSATSASKQIQQAASNIGSNGLINSRGLDPILDAFGNPLKQSTSAPRRSSFKLSSPMTGNSRRLPGSGGLSNEAIRESNNFAQSANSAGEQLRDSIRNINQGLRDGIQDLKISQSRDIADARRTGNVLAIRNIARETSRAAEDLNRNANRDRLRAESDYQDELFRLQQDRQQQMLNSARQFNDQIKTIFGQVPNVTPGRSRAGSGSFSFGTATRS